jgi:sugar-specific transcriptional regulator TrmB
MKSDPIDGLVRIGFSEYEAKAYIALLRKSPVTGYELSKLSGVPRSMIYEVLGKLVARGAAMTLRTGDATKYAPVPAGEFLSQYRREQEELVASLGQGLAALSSAPDLEYVWNIEGVENIIGKATEMIRQARDRIYLSVLPDTFAALQPALGAAISRSVQVVVYTTDSLHLPGAQVVIGPMSEEAVSRVEGLGIILVVDGEEVLISESLAGVEAQASWTSNSLLVFIAEHHLRTDPYLPQVLDSLGTRASEIIREEDRELFARARERHAN